MSDLKAFNVSVNNFAEDIKNKVLVLQKKVATKALLRLVSNTPVKTGVARNNWLVSRTISTKTNLTPQVSNPKPLSILPDLSYTGDSAVGRGTKKISGYKALGIIYIINSLDYILDLEQGNSPQVPPGGIRDLAVLELAEDFS